MTYKPKEPLKCTLCGKRAIARRLCRKHYWESYSAGTIDSHSLLGPEDVFSSRHVVMDNGCWEWTGSRNEFGYGIFLLPGEIQVRAHRYQYERTRGEIPDDMVVMHLCDNPPCVNPMHLRLGTKAENNADAASKNRMPLGTRHWNCRLTDRQVALIRTLSALPRNELARRFGVTSNYISNIITGRRR